MKTKVTKEQFIEVIENNTEGLPDYVLADKLGITPDWFCKLKKDYKSNIRDIAREIAEKSAAELVIMLKSLARQGDTSSARISAITKLLEIAEVYVPKSKSEHTIETPPVINILNHSSQFKDSDITGGK